MGKKKIKEKPVAGGMSPEDKKLQNWGTINADLKDMPAAEIQKLIDYESSHKKRPYMLKRLIQKLFRKKLAEMYVQYNIK